MKKTLSVLLAFSLLFIFMTPVFSAENKDTYYIIMYTKPSYKYTPYEKLFRDHREFLNPENYGIPGIKSISVIAAYRNDNPRTSPPFYVLSIEIYAENSAEASLRAFSIFSKGLSSDVRAVDEKGYKDFFKNYIPEMTIPEAHYSFYISGNIMCSNEVTAASARAVLRISVGLENKDDFPWLLGDINEDGKLTASDARAILRISAGLE